MDNVGLIDLQQRSERLPDWSGQRGCPDVHHPAGFVLVPAVQRDVRSKALVRRNHRRLKPAGREVFRHPVHRIRGAAGLRRIKHLDWKEDFHDA